MKRISSIISLYLLFCLPLMGQYSPNHPELSWHSTETEHFIFHYHNGTEWTVQQAMEVAESVYPYVTGLYDWEPREKTQVIIQDTDDYANGGAYYFDNKILLWASPLEFELRGNHNWMWNVLTHEFSHIVSLGASMKYPIHIPMFYVQWIDREIPIKDNVILEYPKGIGSIPLANSITPMWWAEGVAQFQYANSDHDIWDSHRDMILRDALLHENFLSWQDMGHFGHKGIGNERVYNTGYAFVRYMSQRFGQEIHRKITRIAQKKTNITFQKIIREATGISGKDLYAEFLKEMKTTYTRRTETIRSNETKGEIIYDKGAGNFMPSWSPDGKHFVFQSSVGSDYISSPMLYELKEDKKLEAISKLPVRGHVAWSADSKTIYFAQQQKPDIYGSLWFDLMSYDFESKKLTRMTQKARIYSVAVSSSDKIYAVTVHDGSHNIVSYHKGSGDLIPITAYGTGEQIFSIDVDKAEENIYFDMAENHGRDIYRLSLSDYSVTPLIKNKKNDNRTPVLSADGKIMYFASDRSGIFNIYRYTFSSSKTDLITNVSGSASYPALDDHTGTLRYTLFENTEFAICEIKEPVTLDKTMAKYKDYELPDNHQEKVIKKQIDSTPYENQYSTLYFMPFLQYDYNALKYGMIFYQNETLDKMSLFAMADVNHRGDYDINVRLDFHQFLPRFYVEAFFVGLGKTDSVSYYDYYDMEQDVKFSLSEISGGVHFTWNKQFIQLSASHGNYTSRIVGSFDDPVLGLQKFLPSTYYKGQRIELLYKYSRVYRQWQGNISPTRGWRINKAVLAYDLNQFIDDFRRTESGTYVGVYQKNYTPRAELDADIFFPIPGTQHSSLSFNANLGYMQNTEIDSFFNYYAGGLPGLKGYPFYTIEGTNKAILTSSLRFPVAKDMQLALEPFTFEALYLGLYHQIGDAWTGKRNGREWKQNTGVQARLKGHSWYGFPLALSFDAVYALNDVAYEIDNEILTVGHNWRFYWTVLFDF